MHVPTLVILLALRIFILRSGFFFCPQNLDDLEMKQSSTWMELKSVSSALKKMLQLA